MKSSNSREELESKLQSQALKISRLQTENKQLQKELQEQRRLRNAAKTLVVGVDRALQVHIESLQQPSKPKRTRIKKAPIDLRADSAQDLRRNIRRADLLAYYTRSKRKRPPKLIAYKTAKTLYLTPRRATSRLIKIALRKSDA